MCINSSLVPNNDLDPLFIFLWENNTELLFENLTLFTVLNAAYPKEDCGVIDYTSSVLQIENASVDVEENESTYLANLSL